MHTFDDVTSIVEAARTADVPGVRLIGVDGPSGSGKSTLARRVAAAAGAPVIEVDDFVSWDDFAGWWPRFDAQVVGPLLAGRDAVFQQRDWAGDEFGDGLGPWRTVPWHPIVVLEGVTCTRLAIADRLACRVWVEAPAQERLRRGIQRDGESHRRLWMRWMAEEEQFFAKDDTRSRADVIVAGMTPAS